MQRKRVKVNLLLLLTSSLKLNYYPFLVSRTKPVRKNLLEGTVPSPTQKKKPNSDLTRHHLLFMCYCPQSCSCLTTARPP
jgi:hypothetical protein